MTATPGSTRWALTRKLGLWDRVELPGPTSDLTSEWARASISALTSQPGEGFPLVIQEAMAAGVPVVAYDMPSGPRDQIDDGVDGLLVTQGSEAGLAAALLRLATDPAERLRMGTAAVAKAATWDSTSITAQWLEIYERAVNRRSGRARGPLRRRCWDCAPHRPTLTRTSPRMGARVSVSRPSKRDTRPWPPSSAWLSRSPPTGSCCRPPAPSPTTRRQWCCR